MYIYMCVCTLNNRKVLEEIIVKNVNVHLHVGFLPARWMACLL